jgi:hypothetical protein
LTFLIIVYGRWKLGFNDPTITGWITTTVYILIALLCLAYARCEEPLRGHRVFWWSLAVGLFVIGLNKQLDLHVLLETVCRVIVKRCGWYPQHRIIQLCLVASLATASLTLLIAIGLTACGISRLRWLAFCGILLLVAFIVMQAASMYHAFEMLKLKLPPPWLLGIIQDCGITCIGLSALSGIINHHKHIENPPFQ